MAQHGGTQFCLERGTPIELVRAEKKKKFAKPGFPFQF